MCHKGHSIAKPEDEAMLIDDESTSDSYSQRKEEAKPIKTEEEAAPKEIGLGLFNYLESYRKRLQEMY